jgi:hypothetical protein
MLFQFISVYKFIIIVSFYLISPIQNLDVFANDSDEDIQPLITRSLNSEVLGRLPASDDNVLTNVVEHPSGLSVRALSVRSEELWTVNEDLLRKIDPKPTEDEMNKIIDYLSYQQGGDERSEVIKAYPGVSELPEYLLEEAWSVIENESLNKYFGKLLKQSTQLQEAFKKLREEVSRLREEKKAIVQTWATTIQNKGESIIDVSLLQTETRGLLNNTKELNAKNKCLKIALGTIATVSTLSLGAVITLWQMGF